MIYIEYASTKAAFHFAAEEYIMRDLKPDDPVLMLWQTNNTVMIGANQIVGLEIDEAYAAAKGFDIVRRASGGGTIFTDPGTLLYTIILPYRKDTDPKTVVKNYLAAPVIAALAGLGANAALEGRNDIVLDGKKISGIAQYIKYGYLCSHGSLLFDADLAALARVLTIDSDKIASKALRSIRSRVTNIADHIDVKDISVFQEKLIEVWDVDKRSGEDDALPAIRKLMREKYEAPDWTFGRAPAYTFHKAQRFPGGKIEVFLQIESGRIRQCRIVGDFLALRPVTPIEDAITGRYHTRKSLCEALSDRDVTDCLGSLSEEELLHVLL